MDTDLKVSEETLQKAMEYASNIIYETPTFIDFAVAMVDYMGENFMPHIKTVYAKLQTLPLAETQRFQPMEIVHQYSIADIQTIWQEHQERCRQVDRKAEFQENVDELQFLFQNYRSSEAFAKAIEFVGRSTNLAPYNAMLAELQKPGATFVFTAKDWKSYGRRPKVNAQKLVILKPFGPIQCVFDYSDTEPIPNATRLFTENQLMEEWDSSLNQAKGELLPNLLQTLCDNLPNYGIYLDDQFMAANTYGGYIMSYTDQTLKIQTKNKEYFSHSSKFLISVNRAQSEVAKFHTLCHELGHLFCRHQSYVDVHRRDLSCKEREFEAETVAWIVCKRHGIDNPSEEYLASYAPDGEIPICSIDWMMRAVTEIEKMLKDKVYVDQSLWYKEDKALRSFLPTRKPKHSPPLPSPRLF